jgi:hypothetical protein
MSVASVEHDAIADGEVEVSSRGGQHAQEAHVESCIEEMPITH